MKLATFGWKFAAVLPVLKSTALEQAANDVLAYADQVTGGNGLSWMQQLFPNLSIHLGGLPQWVVTRFNRAPTSLVFPKTSVWLVPDFDRFMHPTRHLVHELAHVIDNRLSGRLLPATFFGGGPADELARFAGGNPRGLRFRNGSCGIDTGFLWPQGFYGNSATAEYFAEVFAHVIYEPDSLPNPGLKDWLDKNIFI